MVSDSMLRAVRGTKGRKNSIVAKFKPSSAQPMASSHDHSALGRHKHGKLLEYDASCSYSCYVPCDILNIAQLRENQYVRYLLVAPEVHPPLRGFRGSTERDFLFPHAILVPTFWSSGVRC